MCLRVCLFVPQDISGTTRTIFTNFSVHVVHGRCSVLLRQGDEGPRKRDSLGVSSLLTMHCNAFRCKRDRPGGVMRVSLTQRGRSVIYDCLVALELQYLCGIIFILNVLYLLSLLYGLQAVTIPNASWLIAHTTC